MAVTPHLLTGLRLALAPPLAVAFARPDLLDAGLVAALVAAAIASDGLDGLAARRLGTASAGGRLFDHGADCLFVSAGLTGAALAGHVPAVLPLLIVVAFGQYVVDSWRVHRARQLRMSVIGRWNGVGYFVPLVLLAAARLDAASGAAAALTQTARAAGWVLIASTIVSIVDRALAARRLRG